MKSGEVVIQETQRAYTYFWLYNYGDSVVANRVLPEDQVPDGSLFADCQFSQREHLEQIDRSFRPLLILDGFAPRRGSASTGSTASPRKKTSTPGRSATRSPCREPTHAAISDCRTF